jgi:hypothetical protein
MSDETRKKLEAANAEARQEFLAEIDADYAAVADQIEAVFRKKGPPTEGD